MTAVGLRPATLALTAVLVPYWIPALVTVRWGGWAGGDPLALAEALRDRYRIDLWAPPLEPYGFVVLPLVIGGTVAALWAVLRASRAAAPVDSTLVAAAILGLPYTLSATWTAVLYAYLSVVCRFSNCFTF